MRAVNLLPREIQEHNTLRGVNKLRVGAIVVTLVVLAAVTGGFVLARAHAQTEQRQLDAVQGQLRQLQARQQATTRNTTPALHTPSVTSQKAPWTLALTTALATRVAWDHTLAELARVVPPNVTLSNVSLGGSTTSSSTSAAGTFSISGEAYSEDGVAQLISRLMLVPDLNQVALTSSSTDSNSHVVTFDVTAQVTGAATAFTTTTTPSTSTTTTTAGGAA